MRRRCFWSADCLIVMRRGEPAIGRCFHRRETMNKRFSVYVSLWLLCLGIMIALTGSLSGQTIISGDITGTVTDPTGATLPNAAVTLTSADSGSIQTVTTDSTGGFRFPLLRPGVYKLQVAAPGFAAVTQTVTAGGGPSFVAQVKMSLKG